MRPVQSKNVVRTQIQMTIEEVLQMTQQEAHIAGVGIATPYSVSTEQYLQIDEKMRRVQGQPEPIIEKVKRISRGTGIHTRHYVHPHWLEGLDVQETSLVQADHPPGALTKDIFTANCFIPPYHERMQVFNETCVQLGIAAARKALADWGGNPQEITHIITTCTSGWSEPGVAIGVIEALGLSLNCAKAELNFNGCFCGATCLRLARDVIRAGEERKVLVVAVEVASTHYDVNATDPSSLVAHTLFADGAAALVLAPEGPWKYEQTGMSLVPKSSTLLRLDPPLSAEHTSYRMYLDRQVGKRLGEYFGVGLGRELLDKLHPDPGHPCPALGIHPGGPNILDHVGDVLVERGWTDAAMQPSYDTLQSFGNLGAAAMLFVLATNLAKWQEQELITLAFGPGVTVEWAQLARVG